MANTSYGLYVNEKGEYQIKNGQLVAVTGAEATTQRIQIILNMQLTEWYLNQSSGMPWLKTNYNFENEAYTISEEYAEGILGSNYNAAAIRGITELQILSVNNVLQVRNITLNEKQGILDIFASVLVESEANSNETVRINVTKGGK